MWYINVFSSSNFWFHWTSTKQKTLRKIKMVSPFSNDKIGKHNKSNGKQIFLIFKYRNLIGFPELFSHFLNKYSTLSGSFNRWIGIAIIIVIKGTCLVMFERRISMMDFYVYGLEKSFVSRSVTLTGSDNYFKSTHFATQWMSFY